MKISVISCPFQTSYGEYVDALKTAIEQEAGNAVEWIASNCGCGDPIETGRRFITNPQHYFELVNIGNYQSVHPWRRWLRAKVRNAVCSVRARRYAAFARQAEVVHFQQILNAYGSIVLFSWLERPSAAARVVTVHELDEYQSQQPERNVLYNRADAIIVHCEEMKQRLMGLGVRPEKIHVILHGVSIPAQPPSAPREGLIFYGGHTWSKGKGMETLFKALALIQQRLENGTPVLKIHGHYGGYVPEGILRLASEAGVSDRVRWLKQLSIQEMEKEYQTSLLCLLPYIGSFAGLPAAVAAANGVPVIATRHAGLPDHLGDAGVWIPDGDAEQLAQRTLDLLTNEPLRQEIASKLRERAVRLMSWEKVAHQTMAVYAAALKTKRAVNGGTQQDLAGVAGIG